MMKRAYTTATLLLIAVMFCGAFLAACGEASPVDDGPAATDNEQSAADSIIHGLHQRQRGG